MGFQRTARRVAGAASGATLGFIAGNIPGAYVGGHVGYKLTQLTENPETEMTNGRKRRASVQISRYNKRRQVRKVTRGRSSLRRISKRNRLPLRKRTMRRKPFGKSKKTKKRRIKKKLSPLNLEQKCQSLGYHATIEQYGVVNDPDCVYIIHSTAHILQIADVIVTTLMRKVMNKAGFHITNQNVQVDVSDPVAGANPTLETRGLRFVYTSRQEGSGGYFTVIYDTLVNQSFKGICNSFVGMQNSLIEYMRKDNGAGLSQDFEPYKLAVYTQDSAIIGSNYRLAAEIYLEDASMELYFQSHLTLQNRTKASQYTDGTAAEQDNADRIDTQPLQGMVIDFKHAAPRVRHSGGPVPATTPYSNQIFNQMLENGLLLQQAANFAPSQQPLNPKYFANTDKHTTTLVPAGMMHRYGFTWQAKGKVINLIKKFRVTKWFTAAVGAITGMSGHSQMVSLEEVMRTNSTNKVTVAYERQLKIGCIAKIKYRAPPLETNLTSVEINYTT